MTAATHHEPRTVTLTFDDVGEAMQVVLAIEEQVRRLLANARRTGDGASHLAGMLADADRLMEHRRTVARALGDVGRDMAGNEDRVAVDLLRTIGDLRDRS